jgi:hypothetical protein
MTYSQHAEGLVNPKVWVWGGRVWVLVCVGGWCGVWMVGCWVCVGVLVGFGRGVGCMWVVWGGVGVSGGGVGLSLRSNILRSAICATLDTYIF